MTGGHRTVPLRELCDDWRQDIVSGPFGSNLKREHFRTQGVPVLKIQNVKPLELRCQKLDYVSADKAHELKRHSYRQGDIVVTKLGSPLGAAAIVDGIDDGIIVADLVRIRAGNVNAEYLCYHINSPDSRALLNRESEGATRPRIKLDVLRDLPIFLPPLPEQERIVAILDEAFAAIATATANAERNLANARQLLESHVHGFFDQLEGTVPVETLVQVCTNITVGHVGSMVSRYVESGVPFLRSKNVRAFEISLEDLVHIDADFHASLKKSSLRPGDLVVVRTGYPGTAAVIPETMEEANCSDLVIVRPGPDVDPDYLCLFFNSTFGRALVGSRLVGAAQKHFNVTEAKRMPVPIPERNRQQQVVDKALRLRGSTGRLLEIHERKKALLTELKQSILHKAFTGELTADSNTADVALSKGEV